MDARGLIINNGVSMSNTAQIVNLGEHRTIVKADIEKGYDRLAHTLTNTLANPPVKLSAREYQIILAVISKTYRFHKKLDWISSAQLSEITGIDYSNISKIKSALISKNVLLADGVKIGINPTVSEWKNSQKRLKKASLGIVKNDEGIVKNDFPSSQKRLQHKKEISTKETNTKESSSEPKVSNQSADVFLYLPLNKKNSTYLVSESELAEKQKVYPAVDVRREYLAMKDWLDSNPKNRKTSSGIKAFVTRWLSKTQNQAPRLQQSQQAMHDWMESAL